MQMTVSKQCVCGNKDVAVIHDFMEKGIDAIQCTKCGSPWTVGFGKDVRDVKIHCLEMRPRNGKSAKDTCAAS